MTEALLESAGELLDEAERIGTRREFHHHSLFDASKRERAVEPSKRKRLARNLRARRKFA